MTTIVNEVKATILALFNANDLDADNKYILYGMKIYDSTIDYTITMSYNYLDELIGSTKMALTANRNRVVACCVDLSAVRIYATLGGISIPTHYNYKVGELTVTKNVNPMVEQGLKMHRMSAKQWFKILMADTWAKVGEQSDLAFSSPIYNDNYGFDVITYDSQI
ncbi:MAG: hypothetical protein KAJ19_25700 [Gammaproteobacteria bacterium]|nr:hypothetical protein [Gammaproteobacteria bacterium]